MRRRGFNTSAAIGLGLALLTGLALIAAVSALFGSS
jgi:hypothetical protein